MVKEISDQDFEDEVIKSELPVLVDMWAPWGGPCQRIAPLVEKFSKEFEGKLKCCRLNVDENSETAMKYQAMSIPLLLFFKDGQNVDESLGAVPEGVRSGPRSRH